MPRWSSRRGVISKLLTNAALFIKGVAFYIYTERVITLLKPDEHLEPLGNGIEVIVSPTHHFSTDTILLAHFSNPKKNAKCVDLGSGCGTIPLLWSRFDKNLKITAVEIQSDAADMITRSVNHNNLADNFSILCADLRELKGKLPFGYFDLVSCNPPYKIAGGGIKNPEEGKLIARHEDMCTMEDVVATASKLLQFSGSFCMCQRPERLTDALSLFRKYDLEPKELRLVQGKIDKKPKLFLLRGKKGGKQGYLDVLPTLIVENSDNTFTDEMNQIYGCYQENAGRQKNG
ncbi:MAG: tRNA1(Val) (adenine(37)-N6)-methyltransferase [Ruminococcaceae bacterium]|nr:tRNA1(Val) (adenine(37)-N6)-methyltransferase [Oscillospiraceae bacterium]